jgi:predicted transcriptional regulator
VWPGLASLTSRPIDLSILRVARSSVVRVALPTAGELKLLEILWRIGEGTIEDVLDASGEKPPPNYKTTQTLLRIMEQKKLVNHRPQGRAFLFRARVSREQITRVSVRNLLGRFFGGSGAELVVNLLEEEHIRPAELEELEQLIRRRRRGRT